MGASPTLLKATLSAARVTGRLSRRIGGAFTELLWFTPWPVPLSERARAKQSRWLADTEPISFRVDGRTLQGFTTGNGPTVLLVHGWGERAATLGGFIEPLTRAGYRVVGVDLPGHGATDPSARRTDIFTLVGALRGVAERIGGIDAVIAHSMGGCVTAVALAEGLDARALVLLAPASNVGHVMDTFATLFSLPPRAMDGLRARIERKFGTDVWARLDVARLAERFTTPALIVHDREDAQIDVADSELLGRAWRGSRVLITSGLGHDRLTRAPSVIEEATTFLTEQLRRPDRHLVGAASNT